MNRRTFIAGLSALACSAAPGQVAAYETDECWRLWRARFLQPDGRVVDDLQGGTSHSDGQGYGLLLAQAHGDERSFRRIDEWAQLNLAVRKDRLMAWQWVPRRRADNVEDWHSATDGDLMRAWALLRGARENGWYEYHDTALAIARDIARLCLAPDPRASERLVLKPGAESRSAEGRVLFNPSYIMPRALRELGVAANEPLLIRAADHGETLLAELAQRPVLPDWIDLTSDGFAAPLDHELRSSYDAMRIALNLCWSGRPEHPAVAAALAGFDRAGPSGKVAVSLGAEGQVRAVSDSAGYRAVAAFSRCAALPEPTRQDSAQSYYPATLQLLANVADRERDTC